MLKFIKIVNTLEDTRASVDHRFKVDNIICEYRDKNGDEYRKSFQVKRGEQPNIPASGTHKELNALQVQFK